MIRAKSESWRLVKQWASSSVFTSSRPIPSLRSLPGYQMTHLLRCYIFCEVPLFLASEMLNRTPHGDVLFEW
ncbi:Protein of unknown function [Gryllus bimaculatus]|nr:Protein of unknown function [Gryllus bimaculatus]